MAALEYQVRSLTAGASCILRDVAFRLDGHDSLALVGESGSGKTMLAMSVLGLLPPNIHPESLRIALDGTDLTALSQRARGRLLGRALVYIPQSGLDSLNPAQTVRRHFDEGCRRLGVPRRLWKARAEESLRLAGLDPALVAPLYPFEISGGMAQKVILALSASDQARLVIADEPTNGLDAASRGLYIEQLFSAFRNALKIIITHDISLARACDRALILCGGTAVESGPAEQVFSDARHPYTRSLIRALPGPDMQPSPLLREGASPCPFYRRCPSASPVCLAPIPLQSSPDHREWRCVHADG